MFDANNPKSRKHFLIKAVQMSNVTVTSLSHHTTELDSKWIKGGRDWDDYPVRPFVRPTRALCSRYFPTFLSLLGVV